LTSKAPTTIFHAVSSADAAARSAVLLVPRGDLATITVTGPDRLEWLQGVLTCNVEGLAPGDGRWGLVLSRQGKILSDVLVVAAADVVHLGVPAVALARVREWLLSFLVMEDADLEDRSAEHTWFGLYGPRGRQLAAGLAARFDGSAGAVDPTGLGGAVLLVPRTQAAALEAAVSDSEPGAVIGTEEDWLRLRVERLVPLFGLDMDEQRNPHEASLDRRSVSWDKGCYLGQEAVCMLDMRGKVKRRLVLVALDGGPPPPSGTPVRDAAGGLVGETRSAARSALFGGSVALSLLADSATAAGTRVSVGPVTAEGEQAPSVTGVVVEPNR
jgi:folate-binding protein YgfZ